MVISNYQNKLIKITSPEITDVIQHLSDYRSLKVSGKQNCCDGELIEEEITLSDSLPQFVNLNEPVNLELDLKYIKIKNFMTGIEYSIAPSPTISLSYVNDSCSTESCTMEDYSGYFAPKFKTAIDSWFLNTLGIDADVTVTFTGNVISIADMPINFGVLAIETETASYPGGLSGTANVFIGSDGIYISPLFFNGASLTDGVYYLEVKVVKTDYSYSITKNCAFIDANIKCRVSEWLEKLPASADAQTVMLIHYGLTVGSNCGCNCGELCRLYRELHNLIFDTNTTQEIVDCGCE